MPPDENIIRVKTQLYDQAKDLAQAEGISMSDAVTRLVENGGFLPSSCELTQFQRVLEARGLTPPKQADWVWRVTQSLPPGILTGTKLEPYAEARQEAELRCALGDELFDKLIEENGSVEAVEEAVAKSANPVGEATEQAEPVAEQPPAEPTEPLILTSLAETEGEASPEASPSAEAEQEPAEVPQKEE